MRDRNGAVVRAGCRCARGDRGVVARGGRARADRAHAGTGLGHWLPCRARLRPQSAIALGRLLSSRCDHAELASDSDAAVRLGLRDLPRADAPASAQPLAPLLARSRLSVRWLARRRALASKAWEGDSLRLVNG